MSCRASSPLGSTSIKPGAGGGQTTTNANDQLSLKEIGASDSSSSADIFSNSILLLSGRNLFSNYPPKRQQRFNINSRRRLKRDPSSTSISSTSTTSSSSGNDSDCTMQHVAIPPSQRQSSPKRRRGFSLLTNFEVSARAFSANFPEGHQLDLDFVDAYQLEDELGAGGYSFVMTARDRCDGYEVAVKFIIKEKVPDHCWVHDSAFGKLPMEVVLLSYINHENVVKCLDVFEDPKYFYLVQELHGSPWDRDEGVALDWCPSNSAGSTSSTSLSTPSLSPSASETSLVHSGPWTPPLVCPPLPDTASDASEVTDDDLLTLEKAQCQEAPEPEPRRRASYDLFECIEQSELKRLSEEQARHVFAQVVDVVHYLDNLGIVHRDIKDENVVIDQNLRIKLIDFGSATIVDPTKPRPEYDQFYGTAAYASSEILLKKTYLAAPAEVWTIGVLLSYLLAGVSPFPTVRDAVEGRIFLAESLGLQPSDGAMDLIRRCLDPNPESRITIGEIKQHPWLRDVQL